MNSGARRLPLGRPPDGLGLDGRQEHRDRGGRGHRPRDGARVRDLPPCPPYQALAARPPARVREGR
eukprot:1486433-Alexandrium_andersonii.AAC.1